MRLAIDRTEEGWGLLDTHGRVIREVDEMAFVVDSQHGLALFPGTRDKALNHQRRIERAHGNSGLTVLTLPKELTQSEANQMLVTRRLPKRVLARMKKLDVGV